MKQQFITKRFNTAARAMIAKANTILQEYHEQGYVMTLRQLHYQFVSRAIYENTQENYKRLGNTLSEARLAGLVDWAMMEDRVRHVESCPRWKDPATIIDAVADQYQEDPWKGQEWRPEVWIEKDALAGVIAGVCNEFRIDSFACRGYVSQSAQYRAAQRFRSYLKAGQTPIVLHFGDHDPSGLDMTRENRAKIELLTGADIELKRLALNIDQVEQYQPPPNPAKLTDARAKAYIEQFGNESWELDALDPPVIAQLIRDAVEPLIDQDLWDAAMDREKFQRAKLEAVSERWSAVEELISLGAR